MDYVNNIHNSVKGIFMKQKKERAVIKLKTEKINFDSEIVNDWYYNRQVRINFNKCIGWKYLSFLTYKPDGSTCKPLRWVQLHKQEFSYRYVLGKLGYVGYKPTSIYRDHDNWRKGRKQFSNDYDTRKIQQEEWKTKWKFQTLNCDFVIDIDGESVRSTWHMAKKTLQLLNKFDVMYSVFISGKKGWTIVVPGHKAIKKEDFEYEGKVYNTHYALALDLCDYLGMHKYIDLSSYYDLRFHKMPYSLDGRNMRPIIPLSYEEFNNFMDIQKGCDITEEEHPYFTIDYWLLMGIEDKGMSWNNKGDMTQLKIFLDGVLDDGN